jgi:hypothetical protein
MARAGEVSQAACMALNASHGWSGQPGPFHGALGRSQEWLGPGQNSWAGSANLIPRV